MKKFVFFFIFFVFLAGAGWGQNYLWTGTVSDDWDTIANWAAAGTQTIDGTLITVTAGPPPALWDPQPTYIIYVDSTLNSPASAPYIYIIDELHIINGTLTLSNNFSADKVYIKSGGILNYACNGAVAEFIVNGGTLRIIDAGLPSLGTIDVSNGGTLDLTGMNKGNKPSDIITDNTTTIIVDDPSDITGYPNIDSGTNIDDGSSPGITNYIWTGTAGDNDWNTGANWDVNQSPGDGHITYTIEIPAGYDVQFSGTSFICGTLTVDSGSALRVGRHNCIAATVINNGTIYLDGASYQVVNTSTTPIPGTINFNASNGTTLAGITSFYNLTIQNGTRTGVGAVTVTGDFRLEGGSLDATTADVTGTSYIAGNITATGDQTYTGAITTGGSVPLVLTSGGDVKTNGAVSGAVGITIEADNDIIIGAGGIDVTGFAVTLEAGGDIDIQGPIIGYRMTATAGGNVTVDNSITVTSGGDHDTSPGNGKGAAIYIEANDFNPTGSANSITPGTGEVCLELTVEYSHGSFDGFVTDNKYHIHNVTQKNLVYYNSSHSSFTTLTALQGLFPPATHDFIDSAVNISTAYTVAYDKDIIIYQIGSNNIDVTFTIGGAAPTGSIKIYYDYWADAITLNAGSGGIELHDADIMLLTGNFVTNGAQITLIGTNNSIDAPNITLNGAVSGAGNFELTTAGTITIASDITAAGNQIYAGNVTITGTRILTSTGGSIIANGIVSGTSVTVMASQGISLAGGANTLNGNITLENSSNGDITFTNTSASITLAAENNSSGGEIIIDQTGSLVIASLKTVTTGSISIDAAGAVTQTGVIETDSLKVEAVTGITLTSVNKVITSIDLTNSGTGDIEFKNDCTSTGGLTVKAAANRDVTVTETAGGLKIDEITAAGDISLNVEKDVDSTLSGKLTGHNITVNAGGDITLLDITTVSGGTAKLNAGCPDHMVYGTPGTVTLTDISIAGDLVIWCESVDGITGTKDVYGNVDLNTDDTGDAVTFLGYFNTIGSQENKERPRNFELGPLPQTYPAFTHIPLSPWPSPITITGTSNIYITGSITAADDLTIETESGDIVFEGVYDSAGFDINLETAGGRIIQKSGSKITAEALNIDSGGAITLAQNNEVQNLTVVSAGGDVEFKNVGNIIISGISAGVNAVKITVTGDIDLSSNITAAAIEIEAGAVTGSGAVAASTGNITLLLDNSADSNLSLARFNAAGTIFISTKTADIVYYSSVPSMTPPAAPPSGLWTTPLFVEANSAYNRNVELKTLNTSNNIYLVDVVDTSSKKLTVDSRAGTGTNGFIEFFTTSTNAYKYTGANAGHLELLVGAGGVRIVNAAVDITGNFTINNALTLDGSSASGIKAANITLDRVTAKNNNESLTLEAGGNITVSGKVTVYQLIAIALNGAVTVDEIDIDPSNTGNEGEDAAIYIAADVFVVTTVAPNTIKPGGRPAGLQWGQLCLVLSTPWEDIDGVVDGPEDEEPGTISGARWHQHQKNPVYITGRILYSFTEDSTGNGRLDRIRVQTNVMLNGNFSGFDAEIINNEYDIDRTKGANGFQLVSDFTGAVPFDDDSFYIYLTEKPRIDGGNTPLWSVIKNESLMDKAASPSLVGNPAADKNIKPIDTIPPRIAYSLTLPGHPQTYLRMTEPVASSSGVDVSASFGGAPVTAQTAEPANLGYLFDLPDSFEIDDLAHLNIGSLILTKGYFQINDIVDQGQRTVDLSASDPDAQPPKYPLNWGYTSYAKVYDDGTAKDAADASVLLNSVFVPPNKLLTAGMMTKLAGGNGDQVTPNNDPVIRRVTDVLVSIAPADGIDNYFAWPVWASPSGSGSGNIFNFDGTAYLERALVENGIELQARINSALTGNLELFWTTADILAEFRNPEETAGVKRVGGLWLPDIFNNPLYYYVSMFPMSGGINLNNTPANNPPLFTYNIAADDLADGSSIKFEFIFRLSNVSDMFAARLDVPNAAAIPHNWYALVRPFAFDIQNIRRQRGGVTILNNVINSNNREVTYLRYHLTRPGRVTIQVYTLDGTLVKSLKRNEYRDAGEWTEEWNGTNNGGRPVARGMYFIRVVGPDIDEIRKVMVVK